MARFAWTYGASAIVMLAMDSVWLSVMTQRLYRPQIGFLLRDGFDALPAVLFYLLFVGGLVTFVALPAWDNGRWTETLWRGALFGLVAYATYDLTNQATVRDWPWLVTVADLAWGATISGVSATVGLILARWISKMF